MKKVKHTDETSTIFFESDEEMNKYKDELVQKGFIKFDPTKKEQS